tara:strand:+ start:3119 stop:3310 length:192 start_codon:yes stop_codon:yes gene_type:complete
MQSLYLSIYVNIILGLATVSMVFGPRVISYYKKKKKLKERQEITTLRRLIRAELSTYFKDLKK